MARPAPAVVLRVMIVLAMLQAAVHRPPYVVVGAPQAVETEHPILCVHTRLTDEVEEWKIQRSLQMVREMGATTIVEFFPWAYIEGKPGEYHWEHSDMVIEHSHAQGLRVIARLGTVPQWAQPIPQSEQEALSSLNHLESDRFDEFARFVEAFTARYRDEVDAVIIWNEPNLAFEWGYQDTSPEQYVELLRQAYPAAHRGNPDVKVLAGALAPTLEPVGSPNGMDDLEYLSRLYDAGFAEVYDALAVHTYGFRFPPDDSPAPDVLNFRRAELLRAIMVGNGDGDKPVFITESGWNDHPRWTKAVRSGQRITYTIDALKLAEQDWGWADAVCLWALRYPAPVRSWPDYFTLVADDFTPKPIYEEVQRWARGWEASGDG
ncbi:MAG: beta-galactosidase [Anaerolineae bacterium]|nr:beta-galactosidase [Anaerolineae bacterium]